MKTEGGEALSLDMKSDAEQLLWLVDEEEDRAAHGDPKWHALWTRSHCEQLVHDQLAAKHFEAFLPKINIWSRRGGLRCLTQIPLFPGYLFIHHAIDKQSYNEICKTRGLVRILGERWDRLASIPEKEIESIKRVLDSSLQAMPHAYVREGQRVRISRGPLKDIEGMLLRIKPEKGLFVVSVDLLQRSVAVEIDCTLVVAA
ncbi:MAG TPA: transcription termination/antitermination NusG family protein [Verrucomicrobiae bacterium]|nr:transcription termination/antitermination NusG family protein [Verrucomicrobiae bacterium]